jgi:membrane protease YdiL (CAAX protease family)
VSTEVPQPPQSNLDPQGRRGYRAPVEHVWPVRNAVALLLLVAALTLAASRVLRAMPSSGLASPVISAVILVTFCALYAIELGVVATVARRAGVPFRESVGMRPVDQPARWMTIALAAGFGLRIVSAAYALVMVSMHWLLPGYNADPTRYFPHDILGSTVMLLVVAFGAPIAEETVFRGVLLPSLAQRLGRGWAVAITTVVFSAMHLNLFSFAPVLLVGWVLAELFLRSRSLWVSIACHSAFNGIGVLMVLLLRGQGIV